jgi:hypothetical protein
MLHGLFSERDLNCDPGKSPYFFRRSLDLTKYQVAARNWNDYEGQISQ